MMPIRALIVDWYDVLYGEKDCAHLRAFEESCGLPEGGLRQALSRSKHFRDARLGRVSGETLWRDVAEHIGASPQDWQMIASIHESAFGLNEELAAFLQELHPHYKIALLSNATPHVRDLITQRFHLSQLFDVVVISAEEGVKKPEPESYERTFHRLQVPAQETVFVDDDQRYVTAAQALGLCGIVFRTTEQVMRDLHRLLGPN
jgi:putative hydrolase of the HAD superfamily